MMLFSPQAVTPESVLKLNKGYSNKRTKFKVTAALQRDTQQVRHTIPHTGYIPFQCSAHSVHFVREVQWNP